ncbi:MAG: restriction endonuclease [Planctomycetes bacterium]|nr:restriction endonuclease [Planctomycetota bacterium]
MANPKFRDYINPIIDAINALGGSARPPEVYKYIAHSLDLSDEILNEERESGGSRYENQVAWARLYLVKAGYIDSSKRGVWSLTDKGRKIQEFTETEIDQLIKDVQAQSPPRPKKATPGIISIQDKQVIPSEEESNEVSPPAEQTNCKDDLLSIILSLPPAGFERLCQRLLRESGFQEVAVTGKSGDGGIDGIGILQINPFVSFKVLFQSKRYSGSVSSSQVRDFRGSMMGRADKGIIITTGTYTAEAKREAVRDGVPPIELVDGEMLVSMFEQLELGLNPRTTYDIDYSFFNDFKE